MHIHAIGKQSQLKYPLKNVILGDNNFYVNNGEEKWHQSKQASDLFW